MENKWKQLFMLLSTANDSQLYKIIANKFKILANQDEISSTQIKEILDECVYGALASDFCIRAMDIIWRGIIKSENPSNG